MKINALHQLSMQVRDLDAARDFYCDVLDLPLIATFDAGVKLAFIDLFGTRLMLEEGDDASSHSVIYLRVDDIDAAIEEVAAKGVEVVSQPHAIHHDINGHFGIAGEYEYMAFVKDPSDNLIAFAQRKAES